MLVGIGLTPFLQKDTESSDLMDKTLIPIEFAG